MEINIDSGSIEIDTDEIVEAVKEEFSEFISNEIAEYFDYHDEKFKLSWMRMQEAELYDLQCSTKENACDHGQKVYRALFRVIEQFLKHHSKEELEAMIGQYLGGEDEEDDGYVEDDDDYAPSEAVPTVLQPVAQSTYTQYVRANVTYT